MLILVGRYNRHWSFLASTLTELKTWHWIRAGVWVLPWHLASWYQTNNFMTVILATAVAELASWSSLSRKIHRLHDFHLSAGIRKIHKNVRVGKWMRKKSHKMSHHFRPALNNLDCEEDIWYFTAGEKALSIKSSYLSLHSCCTETATTLIGPGKVSRKILHHPPPITRERKKKTERPVPGS